MSAEILNATLGFAGGIISGGLSAWVALLIWKKSNAAIERDEIRRKKVEIIYNLLGSRYVLSDQYNAGSAEVQTFNTAMALFSAYFSEDEVVRKLDKFLTNKTDENLIEMLKAAARTANLDLLDSRLSRIVTVNPRVLPLEIVAKYLNAAAPGKK